MNPLEQARTMSDRDVAALIEKNAGQAERITQLETQLDWLKRQLFGKKSEKLLDVDESEQPTLGEDMLPAPVEEVVEETPIAAHSRRRSSRREEGDPRLRFDDSVPVEDFVVEDESLKGLDPTSYTVVSHKISHRLLQNPATYQILRVIRPVVKRKADQTFSCPPIPAEVFEGTHADASFLASVAIDKLKYHLPLYRQHKRLVSSGIHIDRGTLTRYMQRMAELLSPIVDSQLRSVLRSRVLAIDETPIKAGRKAKGKMRQGYIWPVMGDQDEIVFHFAPSRGQQVVDRLLEGYQGTLVNDGYAAYESFCQAREGVVRAQCWTHARRQFVNAQSVEPTLAREALERIAKLYELEGSLGAEPSVKQVQSNRGERIRPLVDELFEWLRQQLDEKVLLPSSPFHQAANYALEREEALRIFLEDPAVPMDTNHLEREIRPIALGRKNWLFCWKEAGAHQLGLLQSLIATCRLQGIDPYTYLVDVMQRVQRHPAKAVHELTPRLWKERFADSPLPSLMEMVLERRRESRQELAAAGLP